MWHIFRKISVHQENNENFYSRFSAETLICQRQVLNK
jgi:hypothetical protein